jgi:hypothetical protein
MPGPPPKPASARARRNKDAIPTRVIPFTRGEAPELPEGIDWHPQTIAWWMDWQRSPLSDTWTATDWNELLVAAALHSKFWHAAEDDKPATGMVLLAGELRSRGGHFGSTPADRARLRIVFADADEKDDKRGGKPAASRERYGSLRAVPRPLLASSCAVAAV